MVIVIETSDRDMVAGVARSMSCAQREQGFLESKCGSEVLRVIWDYWWHNKIPLERNIRC